MKWMKGFSVLAAMAMTASQAQAEMTVVTCEGPDMAVVQTEMTVDEAKIAFGMTTDPTSPDSKLMRFETPKGPQVWNWSDDDISSLEGHCATQYYMKRKPLNGTWLLTQEGTEFTGCPEGVAVPAGMAGARELEWQHVFSPRKFLKDSQVKFALEKINQNHWIARAKPIPDLPGTLDITYEFKVIDPKMIHISGQVTIKIDGGAIKADCSGTVDIVATYQG